MVEAWKLTREMRRLSQQLSMLPEALYEPYARRKHDRAFEKGFPEHAGSAPLTSKVVIILIWQPNGISQSTIGTFKHFHAKGYSVLVVSNAPILQHDIERIDPYVWKTLERPNFGYDFGGYRDGIRFLEKHNIFPSSLIIMNDSIWYPVWPGDDTLEKMEVSTADITGMISRARKETNFLESYFYFIKGHVLRNSGFKNFWKNYRLTSNKYKVIRRGERGFSTSMTDAGLTIAGLFTQDQFTEIVLAADKELLCEALTYSAFPSSKQASEAAELVQTGEKSDIQNFIGSSLEKLQFYSAFPIISHRVMKFPVLKKSSDAVAVTWRRAVIRAANGGHINLPSAEIMDEINSNNSGQPPLSGPN